MLGKQGRACLVTLTDRKSRFDLGCKIPAKKAGFVAAVIVHLLEPYKVLGITLDRGKEFAAYECVTALSSAKFYFPRAVPAVAAGNK